MILFGLTCFAAYHIINLPWPFYMEHLDFMKTGTQVIIKLFGNATMMYFLQNAKKPSSSKIRPI